MTPKQPIQILLSILVLNFTMAIPSVFAADKTWSGAGADAYWNTGANWGGAAPAAADNLIFSGVTRQINTNNINGAAGITNGWLRFTGGGFTLAGNLLGLNATTGGVITNLAGVNVLALPVSILSNNKIWSVAAGSELQFAGPVTNNAGANPLASLVDGGTVRIVPGGNLQSTRMFTINNGALVVDGGNVNVSNDGFRFAPLASGQTAAFNVTNNGIVKLAGGGSLRLAQSGSAVSGGFVSINISSGKLEYGPTTGGGAAPGYTGNISLGEVAGVTTTVTQSGGLVWLNPVLFSSDIKSLNLMYNAGGGTYNLNGGILMVRQITNALATVSAAVFNFNGGTLVPSSPPLSGTAFIPNTLTANVQSGGAIIDSTNIDITISQNLVAGSPSGGLTKLGSATLTLSGANTYTGNTTISNGMLAVSTAGSLSGASAVTVKDGASFGVMVASLGGSVLVSSLTEGITSGSGLTFSFGTTANPTIPPLQVTNLTANAAVTVNVTGSALVAGSFTLVQFTNVTGLEKFQLGSLPLGVIATLVTNANSISLNISSVKKVLTWSGSASGLWDTSAINWKDTGNANSPINYAESGGLGDNVTFNDTLTANPSITVSLPVTPVAMAIANVNTNYTFSGAGSIGGIFSLPKSGAGTVTMQLSNSYTGGTVISAGKFLVGNDNALGSGQLTLSGGSMASDSTTARTLPNATVISANTTLGDAVNTGLITISNLVDFGGAGRTLTIVSDTVFAKGVTNGDVGSKQGNAVLSIKGNVEFNTSQDVQAGTLIYNGATVHSTDRLVTDALANSAARLVITNGASVTVSNSVGNLRSGRGTGAGTATNYVDLAGLYSLPNADSANGYLTLRADAAYSELTFWPGGDFTARGVTLFGSGSGTTVLKFNGGILRARNDNATFLQSLSQALVQTGGANIDDGGFSITINQNLLDGGGNGGLNKTGNGILTLSGANTYTGNTTISGGTLALGVSGSIANSTNIIVAGGATFDVSAASFTLGSSQVLSNSASTAVLAGSINSGSGKISLTYASGTPSFMVTNGTLTLASSTAFVVNNTGAALASGSYKIISKTTGGFVAGTLPAVTVAGGGIIGGSQALLSISGDELYLIVDRPPVVANTVTNNATSGLVWKIAITNLSASAGWSDPDTDPVTLSGVSATSFNGTNMSSDADYIYYNGAVTVEDHFTYTITDGNLTASGTVYLEPVAATAPSISNPSVNGGGNPTFSGAGIPGYTYGVESATSLIGPWINAGTVTAAPDGSWNFTDVSVTNPPVIFYRLYYPYSAGSPPQ